MSSRIRFFFVFLSTCQFTEVFSQIFQFSLFCEFLSYSYPYFTLFYRCINFFSYFHSILNYISSENVLKFLARNSGAVEVTFFPVVSFTFSQAFSHIWPIFLDSIIISINRSSCGLLHDSLSLFSNSANFPIFLDFLHS